MMGMGCERERWRGRWTDSKVRAYSLGSCARVPGPGCRGAAWRCYAYAEQKYSSLRFLHVHRVQVKNAVSSYAQAW